MQRLRVSSWLNPTDVMVLTNSGNEKSPPIMIKSVEGSETPQLNETLFQRGKGIVDDLTLQRTMNNDLELNPVWDPLVLGGYPSTSEKGKAVRKAFFQGVIDKCHQNNMQCLLGYTMMNPREATSRFKTFNDWLAEKTQIKISPKEYAGKVADFLD